MKHCSLKQTRSCKTIHFIPRALNNYLKAPSAKYESLPLSPVPYYFSSISAHQRFSFVLLQHPPYITPTYLPDSNPPVWMRTLFLKPVATSSTGTNAHSKGIQTHAFFSSPLRHRFWHFLIQIFLSPHSSHSFWLFCQHLSPCF